MEMSRREFSKRAVPVSERDCARRVSRSQLARSGAFGLFQPPLTGRTLLRTGLRHRRGRMALGAPTLQLRMTSGFLTMNLSPCSGPCLHGHGLTVRGHGCLNRDPSMPQVITQALAAWHEVLRRHGIEDSLLGHDEPLPTV